MVSDLARPAKVEGTNEGSLALKRSKRCLAMVSLSGMLPISGVARRGIKPWGFSAAGSGIRPVSESATRDFLSAARANVCICAGE